MRNTTIERGGAPGRSTEMRGPGALWLRTCVAEMGWRPLSAPDWLSTSLHRLAARWCDWQRWDSCCCAGKRCRKKPPVAPIPSLTLSKRNQLAAPAVDGLRGPWPMKPGHILERNAQNHHRLLTPAFYGCFYWHSAVHGHWAWCVCWRCFAARVRSELRVKLSAHLLPGSDCTKKSFFSASRNRTTFRRSMAIGWLLRLSVELHSLAQAWRGCTKRWLLRCVH